MNPETPATSEPESKSSSSSKTAMLMMQVLAPAVEEIDSRVLAVFESQKQLNKELERLGAGIKSIFPVEFQFLKFCFSERTSNVYGNVMGD